MDWANQFKPSEIVCLDDGDRRLYAEVIQVVVERRICWVRPLLLMTECWVTERNQPETHPRSDNPQSNLPTFYDLRQGADLLLPAVLFRPALDTEVVPLLTQLPHKISARESEAGRQAHQQLRQFVCQICQTHPEIF